MSESSASLAGRVIWIVGASGTIGAATARLLAQEGGTIVASGRSSDKLDRLAAAIRGEGGVAEPMPTDLRDSGQVNAAVASIVRRHERLDCLVNTTSVSIFGDFLELSDEQWEAVFNAKLLGYMRTMRAVLPQMVRQGRGSIVNVSGRGGRQPTPAHLPGGCANAAVNLLTKGVADAYVSRGIRVNVVAPGPIVSDRFEEIRASTQRVAGDASAMFGAGRMGLPEDVANAVLWLLSDGSKHTTGAVVPVDGGATSTL